jgi:hypothetical protein
MPDEVIAGFDQYGGSARALPLFSCRHVFCSPMTFSRGLHPSRRDEDAAPQDEVF